MVTTQTQTYTAMTTIATALSTEMNALQNGAYTVVSGVLDPGGKMYMGLKLRLASLTPGASNTGISLYRLPSIDGSTFPDGGGAVAPAPENFLCAFGTLSTSAGAKACDMEVFLPGPATFKLVLLNGAGVALANTGNTLEVRFYTPQSA